MSVNSVLMDMVQSGKLCSENRVDADKNTKDRSAASQALRLALDLGFMIALPLVIFALGGRMLDKKFHVSPLFLLVGIFLSLIVTTIGLIRKITVMTKAMDRDTSMSRAVITPTNRVGSDLHPAAVDLRPDHSSNRRLNARG